MIIQQAKLRGIEGLWNLEIVDGCFRNITQQPLSTEGHEVIEAHGALLLPPFIEPHIHLDTTLTAGEPEWNQSGTLFEGIQRWSQRKQSLSIADVKDRSKKHFNGRSHKAFSM